ncbi:MAG: HNH endonuclease [Deltaproteobacteria bacterium]|nr:HNH endonuclease [Deltaproteobacteria bacterium]
MTHGPTKIETKGECIYCGAKDVNLTDEHILPYFIGGGHIIDDASCEPCAKITTRFERHIAKELWDDARNAYGAPSRRKKKRKKYIFLNDRKNPGNKLKIPFKEYPAPMVFYYMDAAGFLLGLPEAVDRINTWTFKAIVDQKKLDAFEEKYPGQLTATMKFNHDSYARLLEKIAYGQIMCSLDPGDFRPICLPYILGEKTNHTFIVGSRKCVPAPQAGLGYSMSTICFGTSDYLLLMVELRIMADNHTPVYHILVGDVSGKDNVEYVRRKINATYDVTIPDDTEGPQNPADEYHWMPRVWPLKNVMEA